MMKIFLFGFLIGCGVWGQGSEVDLSQTLTQFSLNLLTEASSDANEDAFLSPLSVALALGMVYAGANGTTADQIRDAMLPAYPSRNHVLSEFYLLANELTNKNAPGTQLSIANKIYIQETFDLIQEFLRDLDFYFKTEAERVSFLTNAPQVVETINAWVENRTQGRITDLLSDLTPSTVVVLVNAIYFKEDWKLKFDTRKTHEAEFFSKRQAGNGSGLDEVKTKIQMMAQTEKFPYHENDQLQVLGLPYTDPDHILYVFLPKEKYGLSVLESSLSPQSIFDLLEKTEEKKVNVKLPKIELKKSYKMKEPLQNLGITEIFTRDADLSRMVMEDGIRVSKVVHKTFLKIDEEGSEAAAATAVIIVKSSAPIGPRPIDFVADHPFMFMIYHKKLKIPMFLGRFNNEEAEAI